MFILQTKKGDGKIALLRNGKKGKNSKKLRSDRESQTSSSRMLVRPSASRQGSPRWWNFRFFRFGVTDDGDRITQSSAALRNGEARERGRKTRKKKKKKKKKEHEAVFLCFFSEREKKKRFKFGCPIRGLKLNPQTSCAKTIEALLHQCVWPKPKLWGADPKAPYPTRLGGFFGPLR